MQCSGCGHANPTGQKFCGECGTRLGADAARFKGYDDEVHKHAQALAAAGRERQPRPVLEAFSQLQSACVGCHVEFRKPLLERFYPLHTK